MQYTTLALGTFIIFFGFYTATSTIRSPLKLIRLKFMRAKLGNKAGTIIHTVVYAIVPIIFGSFMINAAINGVTIQRFITGQ